MKIHDILAMTLLALCCEGAWAGEHTRFVDPFIGTGAIEGGLAGNNYPGATVPFGMVQLCPDTHEAPDWYNASGYDYNDNRIYGFSHTRLSGTGASDLIDILLFPTTGDATSSAFSHEDEKARPGYYSVMLADEDIFAELTATPHAGVHRYTYPEGSSRKVIVDLEHSANKESWNRKIINGQIRRTGDRTLEGYRIITGWAKLRKIYFTIEFSEPIAHLDLSDGDRVYRGTSSVINGSALKAVAEFGGTKPLECKVGISTVSIANARENLAAETAGVSFDALCDTADAMWEKELSAIDIEGPEESCRTFYTALYHTMVQPNLFSDVNRNAPVAYNETTEGKYDGETAWAYEPVPAERESSLNSPPIQGNVSVAPEFVIHGGDGQNEESIMQIIRRHMKELADELNGEIAATLEEVFSNMPLKEA